MRPCKENINVRHIILSKKQALRNRNILVKHRDPTRLKNKIENNSTWEDAFYQREWVKTNSS